MGKELSDRLKKHGFKYDRLYGKACGIFALATKSRSGEDIELIEPTRPITFEVCSFNQLLDVSASTFSYLRRNGYYIPTHSVYVVALPYLSNRKEDVSRIIGVLSESQTPYKFKSLIDGRTYTAYEDAYPHICQLSNKSIGGISLNNIRRKV